jgi:hypothetical protein
MNPICVPSRRQLITTWGWNETDLDKWDYIHRWLHDDHQLRHYVNRIGRRLELHGDQKGAKQLLEVAYKKAVSPDDMPEWVKPTVKQPPKLVDTPTANAVEQFLKKQRGRQNQQKEPLRVHSTGQ